MSLLPQLTSANYKPKNLRLFYISPFILLAVMWALILVAHFLFQKIILWPLYIGIVYFVIWIVLMIIRFRFNIGVDGKLEKTRFVQIRDVLGNFREEANKYGWTIKEKMKTPTGDLGFSIEGIENGISFEIEIVNPVAPSKASALPMSAIYMPTNAGESFDILWTEDLDKISSTADSSNKTKLVTQAKPLIQWLMQENHCITEINFDGKSMGAPILDYVGMSSNTKEVLDHLAEIVKIYNSKN